MPMRRLACLAFVALVACAPRQTTAHDIERQVWSPYCPGRLLIDCPTHQADELRGEISRRLDRGQSADDVMRWIRLNFGNEAIARPESAIVWSFPVALFVIGTTVLVVLLRRWRGTLRAKGDTDAHSHS
jgi:cytochrome c-type biogenesis protein CcmH/NrfF